MKNMIESAYSIWMYRMKIFLFFPNLPIVEKSRFLKLIISENG